jgi:hypothetical protein
MLKSQCKTGKQQFSFWKSIHSNIEQFELAIETQFKISIQMHCSIFVHVCLFA